MCRQAHPTIPNIAVYTAPHGKFLATACIRFLGPVTARAKKERNLSDRIKATVSGHPIATVSFELEGWALILAEILVRVVGGDVEALKEAIYEHARTVEDSPVIAHAWGERCQPDHSPELSARYEAAFLAQCSRGGARASWLLVQVALERRRPTLCVQTSGRAAPGLQR